MHLHIPGASDAAGRASARRPCAARLPIYFQSWDLLRLFSEPNAFNAAPNRTLQAAGFRYVKTHMTVPGRLNFHQAVNRWELER